MQMNPAGPQLFMLLVVAATAVLGSWLVVSAIRKRPVIRVGAMLAGLLLLYAIGLLGASLTSAAVNLRQGDAKCFDEWCAAMSSYQLGAAPTDTAVQVRLENHGLRAQKSTLARAFIEAGGERTWPHNPGELQVLVPPGMSVNVRLVFATPAHLASSRFVVTEAASGALTPGVIVIGDESSPLHPLAGWLLGS